MTNAREPPAVTEEGEQRESDREQPLIEHLTELRTRLIHALLFVSAIFLVLSAFANRIYALIATPLIAKLPAGTGMIATEVASPFLVPFKLAAFASLFLAMPYILYQVWAFVAPGLYRRERRFVLPLLVSSSFLFYAGIAFAFFVVFPLLFGFFTTIAPPGVMVMTDIGHYLDFILKMFFAFGLAFEIPIATVLLVRVGILSAEDMARKRPYVIVAAFTIGMLLTPPDVVSQILLAVPIWFLFEAGLVASRYIAPAPDTDETDADRESPGT